ncbi:hypothetical protein F4808DRAFT_432422 [Astrocystis sublimbata]|nr:hypothetical protein F4808DRAFT_432422 [Astrocystis sublimbata]
MPTDFEKQSYWHARFAHEEAFEWLTSSETFMGFIEPYLFASTLDSHNPTPNSDPSPDSQKSKRILHLGSGTSDLHTHLRALGFLDVTNVDYEPLALARGRDIERRVFGRDDVRMKYVVADVTNFSPSSFSTATNSCAESIPQPQNPDSQPADGNSTGTQRCECESTPQSDLVLDKSTVDAVSCGGDEALLAMARCVRSCLAPGGVWISLSFSARRFEVDGLQELFGVQVLGKIPTPKARATDPDVWHWVYLLRGV